MRKKEAAHANHERWLVSYADFITLMFAFFVVMYASSQVDKRKVGKLALSIQVAFQELGIFTASNTQMPLSTSEAMPFSEVQIVENVQHTTAMGRVAAVAGGKPGNAPERKNIRELQRELERVLRLEIARQEVAVGTRRDSLVVSLREVGFFDSGSAALRPESRPPLEAVAAALAPRPYLIRIEGHTDNVPIHTARFSSNWELSTARATELIRLFIAQSGLAPERLSAAGYAEFYPVADNRTAAGRALNRRVDIVILPPRPATVRP